MAVADDDDVDGAEKSSTTFGCLEAARLLVAVAVTLLIVAVIGYAVSVVLRPGELTMWIEGGSVSAKRSSQYDNKNNLTNNPYDYRFGVGNLTFTYTIRAVNPSGRVRIYFTGINAKLKAKNSSMATNTLLNGRLPSALALAPFSTTDINVHKEMAPNPMKYHFLREYFNVLGNGRSIDDAWLELNGTRTVENFSGHNMSGVPATYYCGPLPIVGGDQDDDDGGTATDDVPCKENARPDFSS